jgi:hypothetical protein
MSSVIGARALVVKDDGAYSSTSDFDDDTLALFATDHAGNEGAPDEYIDAGAAKHYESLIVQRVLSAQMEKAEQISDTRCSKLSVSLKSVLVV